MKRIAVLLILPFLLFVQTIEAEASDGLQEEIIYDILVDRFNNGDSTLSDQVDVDDPFAYNGGDLRGIINKLDHINQLGFTTISISSIMENSPDGYHGYWIEDFYSIEEQFGTMEDFNELVEEAHKRDLKVVIELVTNYVSTGHPFVDDPDKSDWIQDQGVESTDATAWLDDVAVLNQDNEEVKSFLFDVADFWMNETDIDGFELHAADQFSESFLNDFTEHIKEMNQDFYLLANVLDTETNMDMLRGNPNIDAVENVAMYDVMNDVFAHEEAPVSLIYDSWQENGSTNDLLFMDNKNTARFSNDVADNGRNALTAWQLALTYMYTSPGVPVIFQGSEMSMYGPSYKESQHLVKFNSTDPDIEEFHNRISAIHSEFPVLTYGDFEQIATDGAMSVFKRTLEDDTMYIAINNDTESRAVTIAGIDPGMQLRGLLGDNIVRENDDGELKLSVPRETSEIYMIEENTGFNWYLIGFIAGVFFLFVGAVIYLSRKQKKRVNKN